MKTKFYFLLAKIFVKISYWADIISIHANTRCKICTVRAIAASRTSAADRVRMLNDFSESILKKSVDTPS